VEEWDQEEVSMFDREEEFKTRDALIDPASENQSWCREFRWCVAKGRWDAPSARRLSGWLLDSSSPLSYQQHRLRYNKEPPVAHLANEGPPTHGGSGEQT
jgi:hypothetical protein